MEQATRPERGHLNAQSAAPRRASQVLNAVLVPAALPRTRAGAIAHTKRPFAVCDPPLSSATPRHGDRSPSFVELLESFQERAGARARGKRPPEIAIAPGALSQP